MRAITKYRTLNIIEKMVVIHNSFIEQLNSKVNDNHMELLVYLQKSAIEVGDIIERDHNHKFSDIIHILEEYCEDIYQASLKLNSNKNILMDIQLLANKMTIVKEEIKKCYQDKIKILFLPYKFSMWDSLESIWNEAVNDVNCIAQILPIPYYDKSSTGELSIFNYEGDEFEKTYPILDYKTYDFEKERPDIVYVHNPYDSMNKVTSIDPRFYIQKLKKGDNLIVYVPYYLSGYCFKYDNMLDSCSTRGAIYSDFIILQSEELKNAYKYFGFYDNRLVVSGSPKIDKIISLSRKGIEIPKEWKEKILNRRVILLNSSINTFLNSKRWMEDVSEIVDYILNEENCVLIWRPHPLLKNTIKSMKPESIEEYENLEQLIRKSPKGIIDTNKDFSQSIYVSDGLISDYSSLVLQYTFTGKPSLVLTGKSEYRKYHVFCNYFYNYFLNDGISIKEFVNTIVTGNDYQKEIRMREAYRSVENTDGTCGKAIHMQILEKIINWRSI